MGTRGFSKETRQSRIDTQWSLAQWYFPGPCWERHGDVIKVGCCLELQPFNPPFYNHPCCIDRRIATSSESHQLYVSLVLRWDSISQTFCDVALIKSTSPTSPGNRHFGRTDEAGPSGAYCHSDLISHCCQQIHLIWWITIEIRWMDLLVECSISIRATVADFTLVALL